MPKTQLAYQLQKIIEDKIHLAKCKVGDKIPNEVWKALDSNAIAGEALIDILERIELWLYIPCCHVTGMHSPTHFEERKYICVNQEAEALERFCKDLGINPVTRSKPDCSWCSEYLHYRKGEGLKLIREKEA